MGTGGTMDGPPIFCRSLFYELNILLIAFHPLTNSAGGVFLPTLRRLLD
jgi:hypothetical protein